MLHEVNAGNEGIHRAYARKNNKEDDIPVGESKELCGIAAFKAEKNAEPDEGRAELNEGKHRRRHRLALVLDKDAVEHTEDGRRQRSQDAKEDAQAVLEFYGKNKADGANDDHADDELVDDDPAPVYKWLDNSRKQGACAEGRHRYGNIGNFDRSVEAEPMDANDEANHRELQEPLQRYVQAGSDVQQVKAHEENGKPDAVPYQR